MRFIGFSKGLYSSWFLDSTTSCLFDCGEGCATTLGSSIFKINNLFISHGHSDHIGGLLNLINTRNTTKGDTLKDLNIYYPIDDLCIKELLDHILKFQNLKYKLTVTGVAPDTIIDIGNKKFVRVFKTVHSLYSVGYSIFAKTRRVKNEFKHLKQNEMRDLVVNKGVPQTSLTYELENHILSYCLDSYDFDTSLIKNTRTLILDCCFFKTSDTPIKEVPATGPEHYLLDPFSPVYRKNKTHADFEEVCSLIDKIQPQEVFLAHLSPRYNPKHLGILKSKLSKRFPEISSYVFSHNKTHFLD